MPSMTFLKKMRSFSKPLQAQAPPPESGTLPSPDMTGILSTPPNPIGLFDLPLELRREIYRYCLVRESPVRVPEDWRITRVYKVQDRKKNLLLVSKQVSAEAVEILYGENAFMFAVSRENERKLVGYISAANIMRIRKVWIVLSDKGYDNDKMPGVEVWGPVFAGLTKLVIVAKQPILPESEVVNALILNQYQNIADTWAVWCDRMIEFVAQNVRYNLVVELDDNDREDTGAVMMRYFPNRHRMVKTVYGDRVFKRGGQTLNPQRPSWGADWMT
ncbi:hypothetical protein BU16DRAFT_71323 [Lophium mytilinum]|uniref:Uncharacterized protein n=1 Tax=Lophium mytilinum TaxID=390894 RepID=A0A6A6QQH2_9PEZI|nr:hypothetical protein BU16DRAFT_71323 [Lophium mytilinum]